MYEVCNLLIINMFFAKNDSSTKRNTDSLRTSQTIKHQRDEQRLFVCRVGVLWCYMVRFVCLKYITFASPHEY